MSGGDFLTTISGILPSCTSIVLSSPLKKKSCAEKPCGENPSDETSRGEDVDGCIKIRMRKAGKGSIITNDLERKILEAAVIADVICVPFTGFRFLQKAKSSIDFNMVKIFSSPVRSAKNPRLRQGRQGTLDLASSPRSEAPWARERHGPKRRRRGVFYRKNGKTESKPAAKSHTESLTSSKETARKPQGGSVDATAKDDSPAPRRRSHRRRSRGRRSRRRPRVSAP